MWLASSFTRIMRNSPLIHQRFKHTDQQGFQLCVEGRLPVPTSKDAWRNQPADCPPPDNCDDRRGRPAANQHQRPSKSVTPSKIPAAGGQRRWEKPAKGLCSHPVEAWNSTRVCLHQRLLRPAKTGKRSLFRSTPVLWVHGPKIGFKSDKM